MLVQFTRRLGPCVVFGLLASPVLAQPEVFHIVPERSVWYRMARCDLRAGDVRPCAATDGAVACQLLEPANRSGSLRVGAHPRTDGQGRWSLRVRDAVRGTVLETIAIREGQADVWTDDVPSSGAYLELVSSSRSAKGTLEITRLDCSVTRGHEQAIVGVDGRMQLVQLPETLQWIKDAGRAVARLRFMTPVGEATCTGFLVRIDVLMTNEHCINTDAKLDSLVAEFGYDTPGSPIDKFRGEAMLDVSVPFDYSLIKLRGTPGKKWGVLELSNMVANAGRDLVIVEHPLGGYKQVSLEHCRIAAVNLRGAGNESSDFSHECDTLSGSSGSPVIDLELRKVVGLHHFGFVFDDKPAINQAVSATMLRTSTPPTPIR